jgi:hypothetical protein
MSTRDNNLNLLPSGKRIILVSMKATVCPCGPHHVRVDGNRVNADIGGVWADGDCVAVDTVGVCAYRVAFLWMMNYHVGDIRAWLFTQMLQSLEVTDAPRVNFCVHSHVWTSDNSTINCF